MNAFPDAMGLHPLCLWVERRIGDERHRRLAKRYAAAVLLILSALLAVDTVTMPRHIGVEWTEEFSGEVVHLSALTHPRHGRVLAVFLAGDPGEILFLNGDRERVGSLPGSVRFPIGELILLPDDERPAIALAAPPSYRHDDVYMIHLDGAADPQPLGTGLQAPTDLDWVKLDDGRVLVAGWREAGSRVSLYTYQEEEGSLKLVWTRDFPGKLTNARIVNLNDREPGILVAEADGLISLLSPDGSVKGCLNLTEFVDSQESSTDGVETIQTEIPGLLSVWGRENFGVWFTSKTGDGRRETHFLVSDTMLEGPELWGDPGNRIGGEGFISGESLLVGDEACYDLSGELSWVRRGFWARGIVDLEGDGVEEVVSTKTTGRSIRGGQAIHVFDARGSHIARGRSPFDWGELYFIDLDRDGRREILQASENELAALRLSDAGFLPTRAAEAALVLTLLLLILVITRGSLHVDWRSRLRGLRELNRSIKSPTPRSSPKAVHTARLLSHRKYWRCKCGNMNPIENPECPECGSRYRPRQRAPGPTAVRGNLSNLGLILGLTGLVLLTTTPWVWSVDRPGLVFRFVREIYSVLSPDVPGNPWIIVGLSVPGIIGLSLIYLESRATLGGLICLTVSLASVYVVVLEIEVSIAPLIVIGLCGVLQFTQRAIQQRSPRAERWPYRGAPS